MAGHKGQTSIYKTWFDSQSDTFQKRIRKVLAFFKHGWKGLTGKEFLPPLLGEILMIDSADCHQNLFGKRTFLMTAFLAQFSIENPNSVVSDRRHVFAKSFDLYKLSGLSRSDVFDYLCEKYGESPDGPTVHSQPSGT